MKDAIIRLATGRALIAAFTVAVIEALKHFGAVIPDGTDDALNMVTDAGLVLAVFLFTGSAHNAEKPGA